MDSNVQSFLNNIGADIWWLVVTFWTISGFFSSVATRLPAPRIRGVNDSEAGSGITYTRFYRFVYHAANFIAQNFSCAKNVTDPTWRRGIEMTVKVLGSLIAAGAGGNEAASVLKRAADLDAELRDPSNDVK